MTSLDAAYDDPVPRAVAIRPLERLGGDAAICAGNFQALIVGTKKTVDTEAAVTRSITFDFEMQVGQQVAFVRQTYNIQHWNPAHISIHMHNERVYHRLNLLLEAAGLVRYTKTDIDVLDTTALIGRQVVVRIKHVEEHGCFIINSFSPGDTTMTDPKPSIRQEFQVHMLNQVGMQKARDIASSFSVLLNDLEELCGKDGREMALVRTGLQEASFFAKRAMAMNPENQMTP